MIAETMKLSATNCYLLKAESGYVLIDTAYNWEWGAFCRELHNAGVGFGDRECLILTHHHDDHAGLVKQLVAQDPSIKIVMSVHAKDRSARGRNDWPKGVRAASTCESELIGATPVRASIRHRAWRRGSRLGGPHCTTGYSALAPYSIVRFFMQNSPGGTW